MKFCIIDTKRKKAELRDLPDFSAALDAAGLEKGKIDFGHLARTVHIVVYELGLIEPPDQHQFFSIAGHLFADDAVVYASDDEGATIDMTWVPPVVFYRDAVAVEMAIDRGEVLRPTTSVNDVVIWAWSGLKR